MSLYQITFAMLLGGACALVAILIYDHFRNK